MLNLLKEYLHVLINQFANIRSHKMYHSHVSLVLLSETQKFSKGKLKVKDTCLLL